MNTEQCYARHVLQYTENDVTLSVPKLYFGYATGSNLLFPFAAGASSVLFDERCTADAIFSRIARYRPTILITVPTMAASLPGQRSPVGSRMVDEGTRPPGLAWEG